MVPPRSLWVHRPNRHRPTDRPSCDSGYDVLGPQVALRLPTSSKGIAPEVHLNYVRLLLFGRPEGRYPAYAPQKMAPRWARFLPERRDQASAQPVTSLQRQHESASVVEDLPTHTASGPVLQVPPRPLGRMLVLAAKGRLLEVWPLGEVDFLRRPRPWRVPQCSGAPIALDVALSDRRVPSSGEFAIRGQASRTQSHELCPSE